MITSPFILRFKRMEREEKKAYSMAIFSIFAIVIFGIFAIRPSIATAIKLKENASSYSEIDKKMTQKLEDLEIAQSNYNLLKQERVFLLKKIPDGRDEAGFVREISFTAAKHSVSITNISLENSGQTESATSKETTRSVYFTFSGKGSYKDLMDFLGEVQKSPRAVNFNFVEYQNELNSDEATLEIKGSLYYL